MPPAAAVVAAKPKAALNMIASNVRILKSFSLSENALVPNCRCVACKGHTTRSSMTLADRGAACSEAHARSQAPSIVSAAPAALFRYAMRAFSFNFRSTAHALSHASRNHDERLPGLPGHHDLGAAE